VLLDVFVVDNFTGEPLPLEGQESGWFTLAEFDALNFPAANQAIIEKLQKTYQ
jgi:8-oxo-dGTP diphosphatase